MGFCVCWKKSKEKKQNNSEEMNVLAAENRPDDSELRQFLREFRFAEVSFKSTDDFLDYINFTIRVLIKNIQSEYMSGYITAKGMPNVTRLVPFVTASAFADSKTIEDFSLESKNVVCFPHEHKKMCPAFRDIKYNGFQYDWHKPDNIDGFYFPELELALIHNGQHHIAATWESDYKDVRANVIVISLDEALDVVKFSENNEFWECDGKKYPIEDSRFAMILELYRKRRELEGKIIRTDIPAYAQEHS